jgi:hypothetical protein
VPLALLLSVAVAELLVLRRLNSAGPTMARMTVGISARDGLVCVTSDSILAA